MLLSLSAILSDFVFVSSIIGVCGEVIVGGEGVLVVRRGVGWGWEEAAYIATKGSSVSGLIARVLTSRRCLLQLAGGWHKCGTPIIGSGPEEPNLQMILLRLFSGAKSSQASR